jgi:alkylhydroperoxidase family enzyme
MIDARTAREGAHVACLVDPDRAGSDPRERLAIRFVDLLANDHHAIDADFFREMAEHFSTEEIVEVGWYASTLVGGHRFLHVLDVLGDDEPVIKADGARAPA